MRVQFPKWPIWNFTFPTEDVKQISAVNFIDPEGKQQTLDEDKWRLATGRNGVCSLVLLEKHTLPKLSERADAVTVEYEP